MILKFTRKFSGGIKTYRRLLKVSQKYWSIFLLGVLGTVILSLVDAGFTWLIKPIINKGFINRDATFIQWLPLLIILIFVIRGMAGFTSNYFISRVARNVVMDFRRQIFKKLLHLPASFYDHNSSGHLLATIIYNVEQVAQASSDALLTCLRELSLLFGLIVVMFVVSWQLSLLFLIISPFISLVVKLSSSRLRRLSSSVQQSVGDVTHVADEAIQGYKVVRLYGGQKYEYNKFHALTKSNQQRELKVVITNSVGTALVQLLVAIPIAIALLFATLPSWHITAGSFAAVLTAMVTLLRPVRRLTMVNSEIQKGVAGAESIFAILDEEVEKDSGNVAVECIKGDIEYQQVEFSYVSSNSLVLRNINFKVKAGQTIAIVGRSGSGKSTLIHLLPRFYDVNKGLIKIDGINIMDYRLSDLRHQFSLVSQNTILFDETIANNIVYGLRGDISEKRINEAVEAAHVMEFAQHLPDGLHTKVGEDGVLLSGGQRQRVAIARAILKNAPILILDEATSALDMHSERHIQSALAHLMKERTTLVIAHRLSTVENADWIMVMHEGQLIEQGTHEELFAKNGAYSALYQKQFKDTSLASAEVVVPV